MKIKAESLSDYYKLSNGVEIPVVGFGTWQSLDGDQAYNAVKWALKAGYRHIDTAAIYGNEVSVGKAIKDSGIKREDLFVTTKLWNSQRTSYDDVLRAANDSLTKLDLDYIDLYLIHWPVLTDHQSEWQKINANSWRAMEHIYESKQARSIGVSNFRENHLLELQKTWQEVPMVNQIFLNPGDPETGVVELNEKLGILTEAYSPLGTGKLLHNPVIEEVAKSHHKSVSQILIRWSLEKGFLPLPKSTHENYIKENAEVFDFSLSSEEHDKLRGLVGKTDQHVNPDTIQLLKNLPFL